MKCIDCAHFCHDGFSFHGRDEEKKRQKTMSVSQSGMCSVLLDCVNGGLSSCGKFVLANNNDRTTAEDLKKTLSIDDCGKCCRCLSGKNDEYGFPITSVRMIVFVGKDGRTIVESADGEHMAFGEIAGAIAAVLAPDLPDEASENAKLVRAVERLELLEMHETSLKSLANTGEVPLIADCRLRLPVALPVGEMLRRAFVPLRWVSDYCLGLGVGVMPADRTPLDYSEQEQRKKEQGRYTLEEAAAAIADGSGERRDLLLNSLKQAVTNGSLDVYEPGNRQRYQSSVVREFYEEAYWDDLNQWLEVHQKRIDWRLPAPGNLKRLGRESNEVASLKEEAWAIGEKWMLEQEKQTGKRPSVVSIAKYVEGEFSNRGIKGVRGTFIDHETIKREFLTGITGRPANGKKQGNPPR